MSDKKKLTRRAAIGFIGAGAGLLALNTGAATQIYSDRGAELNTTADENKPLLPLSDESGSAEISSSSDEATIYSIGQNDYNFEWKFVDDTNISDLRTTAGDDDVDPDDITVSTDGNEVVLSCTGSEFSGEYELDLNLEARAQDENGSLSVTAERETQIIPINCGPFYSNTGNYRDGENGEGSAGVPSEEEFNPKGVVTSASNIGRDDDSTATIGEAETGDEDISILVAFVLGPVETADCYTLTVRTKSGGGGKLEAYLRNDGGEDVGSRKQVKGKGGNDFDKNGEAKIDQDTEKIGNSGQLYLLFEGRGNQSHEIEFIDLKSGCSYESQNT